MLEIIFTVLSVWLFIKALGLIVKIGWGAAKIGATILLVLAAPVLILLLIFVGGFALLIPAGLIAAAVGILKACT